MKYYHDYICTLLLTVIPFNHIILCKELYVFSIKSTTFQKMGEEVAVFVSSVKIMECYSYIEKEGMR